MGGEADVVAANRQLDCIGRGFLAVSDNGAGDLYGFKLVDGKVSEEAVSLFDHEDGYQSTKRVAADFFGFLAEVAFRGQNAEAGQP